MSAELKQEAWRDRVSEREQRIRERIATTTKAAQVSRLHAFEDIPFLLAELDAIDRLLARRAAIDDIPDRFGKIAYMVNVLAANQSRLARDEPETSREHEHVYAEGADRCYKCGVLKRRY